MPDRPRNQLIQIVSPQSSGRPASTPCRPLVVVNDRSLQVVTEQTLQALQAANTRPDLLIRAGSIVRVFRGEDGRVSIQKVNDITLRGYMARAADFRREIRGPGGSVTSLPTFPPRDGAQNILVMCSDKEFFPILRAIAQFPLIRRDGGWCPQSAWAPPLIVAR